MSNEIEESKSFSNPVGERLKDEVQRIGGVSKAVEVVRASRATIYNWFDSGLIPATELQSLAGIGIDVIYVVTGVRSAEGLAGAGYLRVTEAVMAGTFSKVRVIVAGQEHWVSPDDYRWIPVLNVRVRGGLGEAVQAENVIGFNAYRREWLAKKNLLEAQLSEVTVSGDSMHPELRAGDTVLVNHSENELQGGSIYVLRQGEDLIVKYLQKLPGNRIQVVSENGTAFPPFEIEPEAFESGEYEIVGRVVRQGRDR